MLDGGRGVVLGKLFPMGYVDRTDTHEHAPAAVSFDERESEIIVRSAGVHLVKKYWGQYVAFLRDPSSSRQLVVRDPSGGVPCQWREIHGIDVYFMRLEDCERLAPLPFAVNRKYFLGYLLYSSSCVRETPLNDVETVLPGERIEHCGENRERTFVWNPLQVAATDTVESEEEAIGLMRRTTRACVHAWANCFDGILHSLSGGLDSSIVLACLVSAPARPRVLCRNFHAEGPNSDERFFARLAAEQAGVELIEHELRADFDPASMRRTMRALFPFGWPVDVERDRADDDFLRSRGLSAECRGHGGDEIFFRRGSFPTSVDYAWRHGISRALLGIATEDATLDGYSLRRALSFVSRYGLLKRPWHIRQSFPPNHMALMRLDIKAEARRDVTLWHPLFHGDADVSPGKLEHAYSLTYGTAKTYDPLLGDIARISPLMSQPLIELSLRTPLYVLRWRGRDRGLARRAFASDLPREIVTRKSKAIGTDRYRKLITGNLDTIRELLLDGFLVRERFVDRAGLEEVLSGRTTRIQGQVTELYDYLAVEIWARGWTETCVETPESA
jgi:asparagine synthase (glutamine-hydrolysing)